MAFRKFQAEKIFDGKKFSSGSDVLITTEEGIVEAIVPEQEAGGDIQKLAGILSPGFINCHCHLELSHMRGRIPQKTGLVDFVFKIVTERHHPEAEILQAIAAAEDEMLRNGIVAVGDICNNPLTIPQKQQQRLSYYNFIEASGWLPSVSAARFERAKELYGQYQALPGAGCAIVPHAPYSVSEELWSAIQPYFSGKVASIHNQETAFEDEFFLHGTGDFTRMYALMKIDNSHHKPTQHTSLRSYFDKLSIARNILLVHNTFTGAEDVQFANRSAGDKLFFCLCPNANRYIEDSLPDVPMLVASGANIVLGTDSLASNDGLSIADEIKTLRHYFPAISLEDCLRWATFNGARALMMHDTFGSFEKGKKPGIISFDENLGVIERLIP